MSASPPAPVVAQELPATISGMASWWTRHRHQVVALGLSVGGVVIGAILFSVDQGITDLSQLDDTVSAQAAALGAGMAFVGGIVGAWKFLKAGAPAADEIPSPPIE